MITHEEIFAESARRWPDFGDMEHHGRSLGFEEAAEYVAATPGIDMPEEDIAVALFPDDSSGVVLRWRRAGAVEGVKWARKKLADDVV